MKGFHICLFILFIIDIVFSFYQYYYIPLDGDMAAIIVPASQFQKMMQDPFGMQALINHEMYMGSNRFFAHWTMKLYFWNNPNTLSTIYWSNNKYLSFMRFCKNNHSSAIDLACLVLLLRKTNHQKPPLYTLYLNNQ